jgi:hypothetical protein
MLGDAAHENAQRLDRSKPPGAQNSGCGARALNYAKHNGGDKGEGHIRGNNAESADESHGKPPLVHVAARITLNLADRSTAKKSALLSLRDISNARNCRQRG